MFNLKYLFILFVIVLLNSCQKEEEDTVTAIDGSVRGVMFTKGSYWIYQDSSTGLTDSTYIDSILLKTQFKGSSHDHATFLMFTMHYKNFMGEKNATVDIVTAQMVYNFTQLDFSRLIWSPYKISSDITYAHFRPKGTQDSVNILGKGYTKVFVSEYDSLSDQNSGTFKRIYIKSGIGIIRQEWYRNYQLIKTKNLFNYRTIPFRFK